MTDPASDMSVDRLMVLAYSESAGIAGAADAACFFKSRGTNGHNSVRLF